MPGRPLRTAQGGVPAAVPHGRQPLALAVLMVVLFLTFLDNTVVSVALGSVQSDLHAGVTPDAPDLIAGRAVMGLGAAASEPGMLSMLCHLYPDERLRDRAVGVWTAVCGLALALGPAIGAVLTGIWDWRAIFWFNLAFGAAALGLGTLVLPESADPGCAPSRQERRAAHPLLDLRYLRVPQFLTANLVALCAYFATVAVFFFTALYLAKVAGYSGYQIAVIFLPMTVGDPHLGAGRAPCSASPCSARWSTPGCMPTSPAGCGKG